MCCAGLSARNSPRLLELPADQLRLGQARELLGGEGLSENAKQFAAAYAARDTFALQKLLTPMEKWKRDALIPALQEWL